MQFIRDSRALPGPTTGGSQQTELEYAEQGDNTRSSPPTDCETEGLIDYARILIRNRKTMALSAIIGMSAAFLLTLPQTPIYRARTILEVQGLNNEFLTTKPVNTTTDDGSNASIIADIQTQIKIINSEFLVDRVVDRLNAAGKLSLGNHREQGSLLRVLLHLGAPVSDSVEHFRQTALKNLTVSQISQTRVIEVLFKASDPQLAADFVNTLDSEYIESNVEARWKMNERTSQWLGHQIDDTRKKLENSELMLQRYARRAGLLFASASNLEKVNVSDEKLRQLQEALSRAEEARSLAQSRYEIAKSAPPDTLADVLNDPSLRDLQRQITDLRRQQAQLNSLFTPKYEKSQLVAVQLAPLEAAFTQGRAAILNRIENDYQTTLRNERLLRAEYDAQTSITLDQADKSIQYNILNRDVETNRQLYESMLQQFKASSVASVMRASNIRIIDPAKIPGAPYSPNLVVNLVMGLIAGLLSGTIYILIRKSIDRTFRQPGEMRFWTKLPELGIIPTGSYKASGRREKFSFQHPLRKRLSPSRLQGALPRTPDILAEAFRNLRTVILFSGQRNIKPRVLVMTSANAGEGKTTVTANLAVALAEIRQKVLIVDADLRKPRMQDIFKLDNKRGLSSILNEETLQDGVIDSVIQPTQIPRVHVLTSGPSTAEAANLLHSPHLQQLFARFREQFDIILIDTPPSIPLTDSRIVARFADAVVLIARAGRTTRDAVTTLANRFYQDRTPILGTVLNDWNATKATKAERAYYEYGSGRQVYGGEYLDLLQSQTQDHQ